MWLGFHSVDQGLTWATDLITRVSLEFAQALVMEVTRHVFTNHYFVARIA